MIHGPIGLDIAVADAGFSPGGAPTPKIAIIFHIFAENCMKMKEFGPPGGGARVPGAPLGSANVLCRQYVKASFHYRTGTYLMKMFKRWRED